MQATEVGDQYMKSRDNSRFSSTRRTIRFITSRRRGALPSLGFGGRSLAPPRPLLNSARGELHVVGVWDQSEWSWRPEARLGRSAGCA